MDDAKVTAEEIEAMLAGDIRALAQEMAAAMNKAKAGRIIAERRAGAICTREV